MSHTDNPDLSTPENLSAHLRWLADRLVGEGMGDPKRTPRKSVTEPVAARIVSAVANVGSKALEKDGWDRVANGLSPAERAVVCGETFSWALEMLRSWKSSSTTRRDPNAGTRAWRGKQAKKALGRLLGWGWGDDEKMWASASPHSSSRLTLAFRYGDRAFYNATLRRFGGHAPLWESQAINAQNDQRQLGWWLANCLMTAEFAEWADAALAWAKKEQEKGTVSNAGDALNAKQIWRSLTDNLRPEHLRGEKDSFESIARELAARGLLPDEGQRAELIQEWIAKENGVELLKVALAHGFSLADRAANVERPLFAALASCASWGGAGGKMVNFLLDSGLDPLEKNASGLDALTFALATISEPRRDLGEPNSFFERLQRQVEAMREREGLKASLDGARAEEEARLGRWALDLIRQGALADLSGAAVDVARLRELGPAASDAMEARRQAENLASELAKLAESQANGGADSPARNTAKKNRI